MSWLNLGVREISLKPYHPWNPPPASLETLIWGERGRRLDTSHGEAPLQRLVQITMRPSVSWIIDYPTKKTPSQHALSHLIPHVHKVHYLVKERHLIIDLEPSLGAFSFKKEKKKLYLLTNSNSATRPKKALNAFGPSLITSSISSPPETQFIFLSDPGVPGVRSMGPDLSKWLSDSDMLLKLNWCDSGWWRYQLNAKDRYQRKKRDYLGNIARGTTDPGYWLFNLSYLSS